MDTITVVATATAILGPFLVKSGEKIAESAGERLWEWIKRSVSKKENKVSLPEINDKEFEEKLTKLLIEKIELDNNFKIALEEELGRTQSVLKTHCQQNIENKGSVKKLIVVQNINGNIKM